MIAVIFEVTTAKGTALILVRFQDAIEELGQTGGAGFTARTGWHRVRCAS